MLTSEISNPESDHDTSGIQVLTSMVEMRDGIRLATDIYMPTNAGERLPVLLERTPYNKRGISRSEKTLANPIPLTRDKVALWFAERGYIVVMQDCRGRYASEGVFTKYVNEAEDGFDTIQWITQQSWCDGRVGTMGLSYGAHTQTALAALNPPGLSAMFIDSGGFSNAHQSGIRRGGAFEMKQATWAYRHALLSPLTKNDPDRKRELEKVDLLRWFKTFPWYPGFSPLSAAPEYEEYFFDQWRRGVYNEYWQQPSLCAERYHDEFPDVPIAIVGSWYDPYVKACVSNFHGLSKARSSPTYLLMGPWTHGQRSQSYSGDADFGESAVLDENISFDYFSLRLDWFNYCFSPKLSGSCPFTSPVQYFVMGGGSGRKNAEGRLKHGGRWAISSEWPPTNTNLEQYFFHRNGELSTQKPRNEVDSLTYFYDPLDPVPSIGGSIASGDPVMFPGAFNQVEQTPFFGCVSPGRPLAQRQDVLVFESQELHEAVEVSGSIRARLWVSSDCLDTDFTVKLIDVYPPSDDYPDGYAMNVSEGIMRARYRRGWKKEVLIESGQVCSLEVILFDTSNLFAKGHKIRVDISSSNYPHFDRNPNTGESEGSATHTKIARNRLLLNADFPSYISLPLVNPVSN